MINRWSRGGCALMMILVVGAGGPWGCSDSSGTAETDGAGSDVTIPEGDGEGGADAQNADGSDAQTGAGSDVEEGAETSTAPEDGSVVDPCANCPTGFCIEGQCRECVINENCGFPMWCRDYICVQTLCQGGAKRCSEGGTPQICANDGESWLNEEPCPEGTACVQGECKGQICEPGEKYCQSLSLFVCDGFGTGYANVGCPPGTACFDGKDTCTSVRPNLLMIFDTSGSMGPGPIDIINSCLCGLGQCPKMPFPACEDTNCPRSRLGLAKKVLLELFETPAFEGVRFAMTRFPQRTSYKPNPSCDDLIAPGHYSAAPNSKMTGDGNYHVAPDNGYFDLHMGEILCVPFPKTDDFDSKSAGIAWVDSDEVFETYDKPCSQPADCWPDTCAWNQATQSGFCGNHTNPELRPNGNTPLGRSLFYAGEYVRKHIIVDGKPCATNADCANPNYYCGPEGTCFDPLRDCRQTIVVLFTDGEETENKDISDFFNPKVQAKRLRYGLGCIFDSDCGPGAKCQQTRCLDYPMPYSGGEMIGYIDGQGANRLVGFDGKPISVTINVVALGDGTGQKENQRIADHGGGLFYSVQDGQPELLLDAFQTVIDPKANLKKCVPEFPPGFSP